MDIMVRGLFATPVAVIEVPQAVALNTELTRTILARRQQNPVGQAAYTGGWHSDRQILDWGGQPVATLIALAQEIASRMTADRNGKPVRPAWAVTAWARVDAHGEGVSCRYHAGAFWSGTYCVEDGGCAADPALGGAVDWLDPRGPAPAMHGSGLAFAGKDGAAAGNAETAHTQSGRMLLFPAWLRHQVRPYRGDGLRIAIVFTLGVADQESVRQSGHRVEEN